MSINNYQPQYATTATGQVYMIQPPHQLSGLSYLVHRPLLHQQHPFYQPRPQAPALPPPPATTITTTTTAPSNPTQTKEHTNARIKSIKEKSSLTHYIDGQIILETLKPLTKKKNKHQQQKHKQAQQPQQPSQQQAQQQIQQQLQQQPQPQPQPQPQQQPLQQPQIHLQHSSQVQQQQQQQPLLQPQLQPHVQPQLQPQLQQQLTPQLPPQQPTQIQPQQQPQIQPQAQQQQQPQLQSRQPNLQQLRAEMRNWSVAEVVNFIERHEDIREYSSKFAEDEVDGKALLLMIDRNLNFQILTTMFKHGPAFKIEATLSKYKLND